MESAFNRHAPVCVANDSYQMPPFYRSPGLAQKDIEVTLPLTPKFLAVISHHEFKEPYQLVSTRGADEINRRTRAFCREWFVSWNAISCPIWFEIGIMPDDAWEKVYGTRAQEE